MYTSDVYFFFHIDADFSDKIFSFQVASESIESGVFVISLENVTIDDNINEVEQSFAIVAEIGDDVQNSFACFQRHVGDNDCFGRTAATKIRIADNDCK